MLLEAYGENVSDHARTARRKTSLSSNPLDVLRERVQAIRVAKLPGLPPFVGGAVGYAGYDTVRYVENLPNAPQDDRGLPDLSFAFYDHMIVFDNVQKTAIVVVLAKVEERGAKSEEQLRAAYEDACRRVDRFVEKLSTPTDSTCSRPISSIGGEVAAQV